MCWALRRGRVTDNHAALAAVEAELAALRRVEIAPEMRAAHDAWARPRKSGSPQAGAPCAVLQRIASLECRLDELRYERALRDHPGACNCAALVAVGRHDRRPSSLRLIETIVALYAYEWQCEACGMRWSEDRDCDDIRVRSQWSPLAR
jgi:hypothetical protein